MNMKCIIKFFKKLLGYKEPVKELEVPVEHRIEMPEVACEMQENLDVIEAIKATIADACPVCGEYPCTCEEAKEACPECDSAQCTCEEEVKVEEPVKKKRRGRPRKKQNKNKE